MSDTLIFLFGSFVALVVGFAVGLLLWGASNQPRDEPAPLHSAEAGSLPGEPVQSPAGKASYRTETTSEASPAAREARPVAAFGGAAPLERPF